MTTARAIIDALEKLDPDTPLAFATAAGAVGGGYHITELKHTLVRSIDCGGREDSWEEAHLQLLDGPGGDLLPVGKVARILGRCLAALPDPADAPLSVEFGHGNAGLGRFTPEAPERANGRAVIFLRPETAACKPAADFTGSLPAVPATCCGPVSSAGFCG
jgi:hypothetical protein